MKLIMMGIIANTLFIALDTDSNMVYLIILWQEANKKILVKVVLSPFEFSQPKNKLIYFIDIFEKANYTKGTIFPYFLFLFIRR